MTLEKTDVVVVGGGQAGIAASEHLTRAGIKHIVLERARTAEHWRTMRWDSLVANGPAWHDRFPNMEFKGQRIKMPLFQRKKLPIILLIMPRCLMRQFVRALM